MTDITFPALGLADPLLHTLEARGHHQPTPIQAQAIPELLNRRDLLGIAQTGTGKTGAFSLPILHHLHQWKQDDGPRGQRGPRTLILAPTRELAIQIGAEMRAYGQGLGLKLTVIYGGVSQQPQVTALARGVDIVIATPGRLLDLYQQRKVRLDMVTFYVLDEADRMLDMGFIHDIKKITAALPKARQSLLFSATMQPPAVKIAREILHDPVRVEVAPQATPIDRIDQKVFRINNDAKTPLLVNILEDPSLSRVIVFTRTKHRANKVAMQLNNVGILTDAFHGNKSQNARQQALGRFTSGACRVLVATDIAARGIDINAISHVINYDLPNEPESYVHRIGRTARAGAGGIAWSFCDRSERSYLGEIERVIRAKIPIVENIPNLPKLPPLSTSARQSIDEDDDLRQARTRKPGGQRRPAGKPTTQRAGNSGASARPENRRGSKPNHTVSEPRGPEQTASAGQPSRQKDNPTARPEQRRKGPHRKHQTTDDAVAAAPDQHKHGTQARRPDKPKHNAHRAGKPGHTKTNKGHGDSREQHSQDARSGQAQGGTPKTGHAKTGHAKVGHAKTANAKNGKARNNQTATEQRNPAAEAGSNSGDRPVKRKTTQKPHRANTSNSQASGQEGRGKKHRGRPTGNEARSRRVA